ncbi:MAG: hypothetical protein HQL51_02530 [Magnetococcales bacterium]|nr:hypothetical protein [Magnetococcales bacterium]
MSENPFGVSNPEQVDADYIARYFVDLHTDLPAVSKQCNTFIHGARGAGKSMLLRSLEPEVMLKTRGENKISDLPHIAVHVPLKQTDFGVPELERLDGYASTVIGEHLLVMYAMFRVARKIEALASYIPTKSARSYWERFNYLFALCSDNLPAKPVHQDFSNSREALEDIVQLCEKEFMVVRNFFVRSPFRKEPETYQGPLTSFLDFLLPNAEAIKSIEGLPNAPIFLMLDDADNLPIRMQRTINSWVSTRSTNSLCLKISTQLGYATFRTIDNRIIESPHDFDSVNLSSIYTSDQDRFYRRMREIVEKRLTNAKINVTPDQYFPKHTEQEKRLQEIRDKIKEEWEAKHKASDSRISGSSRVNDDVVRYAVPRYMREISGSNRHSHTFSYAGFRSLVDLSSGVVRWFLEPASRMHDRVVEAGQQVKAIPVGIQDTIIRDWAREFYERLSPFIEIDDGHEDKAPSEHDPNASLHSQGHETEIYIHLQNLLSGLGRLFRSRLLNPHASEQRVFSVVIRGDVPRRVDKVLRLGIRLGYFQDADYAAKEALGGRLPRIILARRLGPYFNLDVSGYAAHLSVTGEDLSLALSDPKAFLKKRTTYDRSPNPQQLTLDFDGIDDNGHTDSD